MGRGQDTGTLGVALRSANLLKMWLVTTAAMLAIYLLALGETTNTAEAEDSLPENGKIAFSNITGTSGMYEIYTVEPDGSGLSQLTNNVNLHNSSQPAWSPDGTKIAVGDERRIWVMGADGSILRRLTPNGFEVHYSGMSWSRDGTKLAFSMFSYPHEIISSDIYMMDVDGSNKINITNSPHMHESDFDISPEGSQMCLYRTSDEPLYKSGIYVMNVDASNPTRLTDIRGGGCAWSPDGQKIAYSYESRYLAPGGETVADVYVMNADGSGKTNLTKNRAWDGNSEWSPDGTRIAFTSSRDGDPDIYTMDADGSDVTQVTNLSGDEQYPNWQPLTQKSRSMTVHPPYTGGPSLSLVASTLLFFGGGLLCVVVRRRM